MARERYWGRRRKPRLRLSYARTDKLPMMAAGDWCTRGMCPSARS